jgi:hypothetical protein
MAAAAEATATATSTSTSTSTPSPTATSTTTPTATPTSPSTPTSSPSSSSTPAPTAPTPPKPPPDPALHHTPLAVAPVNQDIEVAATIDRPDEVTRATLLYRHAGQLEEVTFERSSSEVKPYVAIIPAAHVVRPSIAYAIEIQRTDGQNVAVFASRSDMHPVEVVDDIVDAREEDLLRRLRGRRFVVNASGEYAYFGTVAAPVCSGTCTGGASIQNVADRYWHTEAGVTYRMLRTLSEFGIRGGVYRGSSAVPNTSNASQFNVGLNYGAPWIRIRGTDWLHLEGEFLTSVTEVGFSLGGGGAILLGNAYGSHLTLGFESVDVFGSRGYSRFDGVAGGWLHVASTVEVTNMPHASTAGVRLLMDVGAELGAGWLVTVRGGYQARTFAGGGPAAGGALAYAF